MTTPESTAVPDLKENRRERSKTNPARRLCSILEDGKSRGRPPQRQHEKAAVVMASLFGLNQNDVAGIYDKQAALFRLHSRTSALLTALDHPQKPSFLTCLPGIEAALRSINLNEGQNWSLNENQPT